MLLEIHVKHLVSAFTYSVIFTIDGGHRDEKSFRLFSLDSVGSLNCLKEHWGFRYFSVEPFSNYVQVRWQSCEVSLLSDPLHKYSVFYLGLRQCAGFDLGKILI